jgi:hypothetical protein
VTTLLEVASYNEERERERERERGWTVERNGLKRCYLCQGKEAQLFFLLYFLS